jgi:histidyl-tRNA synthetase
MSAKIQAIRGMNDLLPSDSSIWAWLEANIRAVFGLYGYQEIRFPIVENTGLFVRSLGEVTDIVEKEMYTFVDNLNGESLTLRPEGTASTIRAVLEHNLLYDGPKRLWYAGPMFRHEKPQRGRYRQFHQFGLEALGFPGPDVEAEQIILTARLWRELGLRDVELQLNTLGNGDARAAHRAKLIEYFSAHMDALGDEEKRRLQTNPLRILDSKNPALKVIIADAPTLLEYIDAESREHFDELQSLLRAANIAYTINPRLVRGLDYYNRTVFEWVTTKLGSQGTICAGGRYDGLIEQLGGKPAPGCGFAMGVERLIEMMKECGTVTDVPIPDAYVVHQGEGAMQAAFGAAETARDAGLEIVLHAGGGNFKSQLKRADASAARFAMIFGEDEVKNGKLSLKPLRGQGEQATIDLSQAIESIKQGRTHGSL